ncbi:MULTISPECIES: DUF771 domain-containing protein [unclassified Lactococcus]|uniref:DUF771 domain-containing protein n=1 Tax=unclassified Lactococcus TaxID=2643510 RepID=UPI0011C9E05A|nr:MULTISPECIES: DUF771 domain-containing protein [unclassified Lactococcus]MQW23211.1 DUF771 domain-containing protein [Lactococcus sp. dk101]TXK38118.1 DUF771 domain-containing protein [Lactococcus sp. dk310]TXK49797.1 DUF771 domain-containing protein [Lactococcus sp. dk322]
MKEEDVFTPLQLRIINQIVSDAVSGVKITVSDEENEYVGWEWLKNYTGRGRTWLVRELLDKNDSLKARIDEAKGSPTAWVKYPKGGRNGYSFNKNKAKAWLTKNSWVSK